MHLLLKSKFWEFFGMRFPLNPSTPTKRKIKENMQYHVSQDGSIKAASLLVAQNKVSILSDETMVLVGSIRGGIWFTIGLLWLQKETPALYRDVEIHFHTCLARSLSITGVSWEFLSLPLSRRTRKNCRIQSSSSNFILDKLNYNFVTFPQGKKNSVFSTLYFFLENLKQKYLVLF